MGNAEHGQDGRAAEHSDGVLLLALGVLAPVLLFLPVPSRLIYYCLPAVPAFAVLAAGWWTGCNGAGASRWERPLGAGLLALVGAATLTAGFWLRPLLAAIPDLRAAPGTLDAMPIVAWLVGAALVAAGVLLWLSRPQAAVLGFLVFLGLAATFTDDGFRAYEDVRSSRRLVRELDPLLGPEAVWVSEGSYELGASAGLTYYLGPDAQGRPRTVRVMTDDERRPQPEFCNIPRAYATSRAQLQALWDSPTPVVFVTDLMRRDFSSPEEAPRLPERAGPVVGECGFRRVYANAAARQRLTAGEPQMNADKRR